MSHRPVLLKEVVEWLKPGPGQKFIDATINGGGHAEAILEKITPDGKLLGIEQDEELLKTAKEKFRNFNNIVLANDNFENLKNISEKYDFGKNNGIIFDLGVSSWHFEDSGRGFSFQKNELLDMRLSKKEDLTAAHIVNEWKQENIEFILREYGGESFAKKISENIIEARKKEKIETTNQLVEIISKSVPNFYKNRKIHFATKTFQALRIAVNRELEVLEKALEYSIGILVPGGRLAVISFHSGEDRIIKNKFREFEKSGHGKILTRKPIVPAREEIKINPRARSAKLREYEQA